MRIMEIHEDQMSFVSWHLSIEQHSGIHMKKVLYTILKRKNNAIKGLFEIHLFTAAYYENILDYLLIVEPKMRIFFCNS